MKAKVYTSVEDFKKENELLKADLPFCEQTDILKDEVKIGNLTLKNRLVCQAMEGCDGTSDGRPDVLTKRRYERLAKGGAGLIWFEATAVCFEGRANPRQLYINDKNLDSFKEIVESIKQWGMKQNGYEPAVIMQATHSGRYSKPEGKPAPIIAYNNPVFEKDNPIDKSRIITDEGLDRVHDGLVGFDSKDGLGKV